MRPLLPAPTLQAATLHASTRRELLLGSGVLFAWAFVPRIARAEGRDPRFLTIVLRGALDGLAAVAPVGDPDWIKLRGDNALRLDGKTPALPLDGFFALNPAMPNVHRFYQEGHATIVHAAATPYRERSHFDGQDVLESGLAKPGAVDTGWLNRALAVLEPSEAANTRGRQAFAVGPVTPLVVRGPARVLSWTPPRLPPVSEETTMRLLDLYRHTDPTLARVLEDRLGIAAIARAGSIPNTPPKEGSPAIQGGGIEQVRAYFAEAAGAAAKFLASPEGPRIGALAFDGWDTHVNEGAVNGRLANLLGALDGAIAAIKTNMGEAWNETVVALVTEFGRTAHVNGNEGTDHGTATVALLAGRALKGGRVIADWPGLKEADLYEKRDLKPTTDLRAVLKGVLRDHLRVEERALAADVFPGSEAVGPMAGLLA
ncbi:MAG TPA: DUF1501 domain-containing protein [Xanthobacteraceae bacterium]